jgi:hypothetical protein
MRKAGVVFFWACLLATACSKPAVESQACIDARAARSKAVKAAQDGYLELDGIFEQHPKVNMFGPRRKLAGLSEEATLKAISKKSVQSLRALVFNQKRDEERDPDDYFRQRLIDRGVSEVDADHAEELNEELAELELEVLLATENLRSLGCEGSP